ncbi:translation factor GUF1 homolog, mitochondrial isoform X1 [Colletes gigas]|uniref:translation factor GUF1 homolog, mitochondrial isoform X1 n=1 Tax=Colletes gigas TaxID=935657 RepID=UPI001C9B4C04|nr:translation factor GUF1 homolog, mitochondrial isoform X1 [Colletes gigas]
MKINKIVCHVQYAKKNHNFFRTCVSMFNSKYWHIRSKYYSTTSEATQERNTLVENIRNFSIIAHVDHGKSTLADRFLELTGAVKTNSGKQILDNLQVEKDRGITVKAQTASLNYTYKGTKYLLNLIDTPGHVDFSAEVHRSLAPCQGVVLVIDANDGVQAQTVANFYLAIKQNLVIIPVINKIDLKTAKPDRVISQLKTLFDIKETDVLKISAKLGTGVVKVLDAVIEKIPPPDVFRDKPLRALTFDSWYDKYRGAISLVYIKEGSLSIGDHIVSMLTKKSYEVKTLSLLRPSEEIVNKLFAGQIGCVSCNMKSSKEALIGDTLHLQKCSVEPLLRIKSPKPMVFSGVYPLDQSQFGTMRTAIEKLTLNDSGVSIASDSSVALGQGWRVGFLGLLHMEVFMQRLEQEYNAQPIVTIPNVTYKATIVGNKNIKKLGSDTMVFNNPADFPNLQIVSQFYEPIVLGTIITPVEYIGVILSLCMEKRGTEETRKDIGNNRVMLQFLLPLNEIIVDFHDSLKCITSGYASFDYEEYDYKPTNIVKLNIVLNGIPVEELSSIVHISKSYAIAKQQCEKLVEVIPRQMFEIAIQAVVNGKVIVRETLRAFRKDVTAKLYGGDVSRKKKLLAQQAQGKKQMKMVGKISLPRDTFIKVLKR